VALFRQLRFDVGVHSLSEGALDSNYRVELDQNIFLDEPKATLAGFDGGRVQLFIDGTLGQGDAIRVALGDQPAQDSQAIIQVRHPPNMHPDSRSEYKKAPPMSGADAESGLAGLAPLHAA
jgi:hypothetical protein